jgi:hypothetical protein
MMLKFVCSFLPINLPYKYLKFPCSLAWIIHTDNDKERIGKKQMEWFVLI